MELWSELFFLLMCTKFNAGYSFNLYAAKLTLATDQHFPEAVVKRSAQVQYNCNTRIFFLYFFLCALARAALEDEKLKVKQ